MLLKKELSYIGPRVWYLRNIIHDLLSPYTSRVYTWREMDVNYNAWPFVAIFKGTTFGFKYMVALSICFGKLFMHVPQLWLARMLLPMYLKYRIKFVMSSFHPSKAWTNTCLLSLGYHLCVFVNIFQKKFYTCAPFMTVENI